MKSEHLMLRRGDLNCDFHVNSELEILWVEQGGIEVKEENGSYTVRAEEGILILPYQLHSFVCEKGAKATVFMFSYPIVEEFHNAYKTKQLEGYRFVVDKELALFLNYCLKSFSYKEDECIVKSIFYAFAAAFLRNKKLENRKSRGVFSVQELVEYVFFHLAEELTLGQLATVFGINKNTLGSLFRDTIGITFGDFVNNVRLERAKSLLVKSDMTVTEIAYECGFGCVRSLNRTFTKCLSCTPTEYRKRFL